MNREFIIIPSFEAKWKHLGLTDDDLRDLQLMLLSDPKIGDVMQGTGGVRKVRFAFENRGKSGSLRVIYVDFEVYETLFLIDVFQKSEKSNLTKNERNTMKGIVEIIEISLERGQP